MSVEVSNFFPYNITFFFNKEHNPTLCSCVVSLLERAAGIDILQICNYFCMFEYLHEADGMIACKESKEIGINNT
jgi:hypothetical protein